MNEPNTQAAALRELLRTLIRKLGLLERSEAVCCEVTLSQCNALVEIGRVGVLSVNQLADRLNLDKSTVSRVSDKLVLDGLLLRQEDPDVLVVEARLRPLTNPMKMNGCTLTLIGAPAALEPELQAVTDWVVDTLGDPGGRARVWRP